MQAHQLYGAGHFHQAEALYRQVLIVDPVNRDALQTLVAMCLKEGRMDQAEQDLARLTRAWPEDANYCSAYANVLAGRGKIDAAIACYETLFQHKPRLADSRYNFALLLKQAGRYEAALEQYQKALSSGVSNREEVFSNISVVLSELNRHDEAQTALEKALAINSRYEPALYNLALLHEERGRRDEARKLLRRILKRNPAHVDALARLAHGKRITDPSDPTFSRLHDALAQPELNANARETLLFSLGKVHDDCGRFDEAFDYYRQANLLSQHRSGAYDRAAQEALTARLMDSWSNDWLEDVQPVSDARLIFICGMFRSGSTLLEQMLASHPALTAGGEIAFFNEHAPLPLALDEMNGMRLHQLGGAYLEHLNDLFGDTTGIINKRLDNFLYVGLIHGMFPNARFLNTRRQPLDNCLSVYFQQLAEHFEYANELVDIGHYYSQYRQLVAHWRKLFPASIIDVDYDELVKDPEAILKTALAFIGLDWDPACLAFYESDNRVRTASVWQVRQPLHPGSSGRWRNYENQLAELQASIRASR